MDLLYKSLIFLLHFYVLFITFILSTSLRSISLKKIVHGDCDSLTFFDIFETLFFCDFLTFLTFLWIFFTFFRPFFFCDCFTFYRDFLTFWLSLWLFLCDVFVTFFSKVFDIFLFDLPLSDDGITKILNLYTVGCWIGVILKQNIFRFLLFLTEFLQVKKKIEMRFRFEVDKFSDELSHSTNRKHFFNLTRNALK